MERSDSWGDEVRMHRIAGCGLEAWRFAAFGGNNCGVGARERRRIMWRPGLEGPLRSVMSDGAKLHTVSGAEIPFTEYVIMLEHGRRMWMRLAWEMVVFTWAISTILHITSVIHLPYINQFPA